MAAAAVCSLTAAGQRGFQKVMVGDLPLYLCGSGARGAVVICSEWWGVNDNVLAVARDDFAARTGLAVCVPDFYRG